MVESRLARDNCALLILSKNLKKLCTAHLIIEIGFYLL